MVRVAINGYGRIGRVAHRVILERHAEEIEVVAINAGSSTDLQGWAYLLQYDTAYGPLTDHKISVDPHTAGGAIGSIVIDDKKIPVYSQKDPSLLPWKSLAVDVVIESTGHFTSADKLQPHLTAGAKAVVLSAPAKESEQKHELQHTHGHAGMHGQEVSTYVLSVNQDEYSGESMVSNASCTTNCITPVARVMVESFGVEKAMMTTVHSYTSDQELQDGGHKDYRRARAAGQNIIPTTTGATIAAAQALPELEGVFNGLSIRVPTIVGSLSDFTFLLKKHVTVEEVNEAIVKAADHHEYKGILAATTDPIVSSDIVGNSHSSIVDLSLTQVVGGNMVKVIAWYDNEFGYANRLVEEVVMVGKKLSS